MKYSIFALALLITEILIALFVKDRFIRPFFGDYLAVFFVYCSLRAFIRTNSYQKIALLSLLISYFVEFLQYFKFIEITGLAKYKVLAVVIGNSFSWYDMLAYTLAYFSILILEKHFNKSPKPDFETFVRPDSIVRKIWSDTDSVLFIFAACAGEFALSKSVDWLFFTGKLPNDPIGRLFSTVAYAQQIIFKPRVEAEKTLENMKKIHVSVEENRGYQIPNWAYQDVLYMLIAYSISAYELLHRALTPEEKKEVFDVFREIGLRMGISELPESYEQWRLSRNKNLATNYVSSENTQKLYAAYKKQLGAFRFGILLGVQNILLNPHLKNTLQNYRPTNLKTPVFLYKITKSIWPVYSLKYYLLPVPYRKMLRQIG